MSVCEKDTPVENYDLETDNDADEGYYNVEDVRNYASNFDEGC